MNDNYQVRCPVCFAEQDFRTRREADARAKALSKRESKGHAAMVDALEDIAGVHFMSGKSTAEIIKWFQDRARAALP